MDPMIINLAVTGTVHSKSDNPNLPVTVDEIVEDVCRCSEIGATMVHIHAREKGEPSYRKGIFREIISAVKENSDVVICVSTSGRIFGSLNKRTSVLNLDGEVKPDLASITPGSLNFPNSANVNPPGVIKKILEKIKRMGIKPEYEIFETGMINYVNYLRRKGYDDDPDPYFNLFLGSLGTMPARESDLDHLVGTLKNGSIWAAAGIGRYQLPVNTMAIRKGGHVRVGLEDSLYFDYKTRNYASNPDLVRRIVEIAKEEGRRISTVDETRAILGI